MDSKEDLEKLWMVAKDRHELYGEMGIGEGHASPVVRGETPRMRKLDQSPATAATNGLMMEWASVASWFFRPEGPGSVVTTSSSTNSSTRTSAEPHFALAPTICTAIRCTVPGCTCECFTPGKLHIRYCESCSHGWVPHALDKLGFRHVFGQSPVEPVQPNVAFDIASLVLYGCQALPIRLKILLDRLFSVLQREEVLQVLRGFGWSHEDYARGYILQEPHGAVLDRWNICSPEEEPLVLQQFLRFGETRAITQQLLLHSGDARGLPRLESDIQKFIERAAGRLPTKEEDRNSRISIKPIQQLQQPRRGLSPPPAPVQAHPPMGVQHHLAATRPPPPPASPQQKQSSMSFLKLPPTGLSCTPATTSNGPIPSSPPSSISSSPISVSPLNRLQSMQPFDFRKIATGALPVKGSPERRRASETSESSPPGLMNLCVTSPNPVCPPPPPPPHPATSTAMSIYPTHRSPPGDPTGSSEFGSDDDDDDEENSHSALNLSRDAAPKLPRPNRPQHMRKTATPMKRQWGTSTLPLNLGTQLINPATGKKRVQCNVCLKTFCDKGALKIHFSAVHLREMHKCTVEGCNMMFSSRRSRNRHSANPNPKLHSPHLRRKISPHDGRSAQSHPILIPPIPPSALNPLSFGTFPLLAPTPDMRHQQAVLDLKQSLDLSLHRHEEQRRYENSSDHMDDYMMDDDDEEGIVVVGNGDDDDDLDCDTQNGDKHDGEKTKRFKLSESDMDMDEDMTSNMDSNDDSLSVVDSQSTKEENVGDNAMALSKSVRKRKNQNPTRCAIAQPIADDDGIMTDEESSNDVFQGAKREDRSSPLKEHDIPKNFESDLQPQDLTEKNSKEQENTAVNLPTRTESPLHQKVENSEVEKEDQEREVTNEEVNNIENNKNRSARNTPDHEEKLNSENNNIPIQELKHEKTEEITSSKSPSLNKTDDQLDSTNALRQLENLSQGNFGDMAMNRQHESFPMNFMMGADPPSPARSQSSSVSSGDSPSEDNGDHIYGHFQDGTFISTMDVPIDKDNPRMCTACGKMFQNHFGVKTHYQNVHLKLMHKCTVDGCNAAFPSKRSRDRHSANLNLHRKLLSTSLTDKTGSLFLENSPFSSLAANTALHNEFLSRFYADPQSMPLGPPHLPPPGMMNGDRLPPHPPIFLPPLGGLPGFPGMNNFPHLPQPMQNINGHSSGSASPISPASSPVPPHPEEDLPVPDRDGLLPCRFCHQPLQDASALKEHYEQHHSSEMFRCSLPGCGKLFTSRRKRDSHQDSESAHQPPPTS
ncbi:zinc finger protein basonuclin-2-like isoform X3 [Homalodisca vitripennis]|uniref:zinc finger protein basonuclin-2-like isoform X3 n=1 Tax=Homalodisca vitripennis TaxID=197043 RepID=UPI001EEA96CD|nr:zinc finger protein basonuclin-2-like isoform X3 [Homalodisca vitripennis]